MMIDLEPNNGQDWSLSERRAWIAAGLMLAIHMIAVWQSRDIGILLMRDDARYLILANSLVQGGYNDLFLVSGAAHSLYPPVVPALLLAWGSIFGDSFGSFIVMNIVLSASALVLLFAAVKRIWGPVIALACLAPLCINPLLVERAGGLRSETAYMFFSLAALWALSRARPTTQGLLITAIAALMAALTRSVGIVLLASILILWLSQRRYKAVTLLTCAALATVGAWVVWTFVAPQQHAGSSYIGDFVGAAVGDKPNWVDIVVRRTGVRLGRYFGSTLPWSLPIPTLPGTPIDNVASSLFVVVSLGAGLLVLFKRWRIVSLYVILYAGALLAYPFMRARFLEPVLPLLILALMLGAGALVATVRPRWATPTILAMGLMLTITGAVRSTPRMARQMACGPFDLERPPDCLTAQQNSFLRAAHYVSTKTSPTDVFITKMPETLYYYTGRRSIDAELAMTVAPARFLDYLSDQGVTWALLTAGSPQFAYMLRVHCSELAVERIFYRRTVLFRLPSSPEAEGERLGEETAEACSALDDYLTDYPQLGEKLTNE